jgi:hypothetical protein
LIGDCLCHCGQKELSIFFGWTGSRIQGGTRAGSGRKRQYFADNDTTAAQKKSAATSPVRVDPGLKTEVLARLATKCDGDRLKANAMARHVNLLLQRWLDEDADPRLAAQRLLAGSFMEELAEPRKRTPGRAVDGDSQCLLSCSIGSDVITQSGCLAVAPV